jgi:hypothetical protein
MAACMTDAHQVSALHELNAPMTTWKIEITEPHSGELGEAILQDDHGYAF